MAYGHCCLLVLQCILVVFTHLYLPCHLPPLPPPPPKHLIESLWYAVLETFILLAAFHQELNFIFVSMVMTLFIVKSFHWLANDRIDFVSTD